MKFAIDAMGGDNAPRQIIVGVIEGVKTYNVEVVLVGIESVINEELKTLLPKGDSRITVAHADDVVTMEDKPSQIIRGKRNSSMHVGLELVKSGDAVAFYSAGNTGAVMATAILKLRTLSGISRPAIATALPSIDGHSVLIDVGANVDAKPDNYLQFAIMGSAYAKSILNLPSPKVGLLSIGEEDVKGNEITKTVFQLLKECKAINFIGNVEAKRLYRGEADVIVCDGFVGNVALKTSEAVASFVATILKNEIKNSFISKIGALLLIPALNRFKKRVDYEEYGGAPLLGVGGVCLIGHGSSKANAVKNAIRVAKDLVTKGVNKSIEIDVGNSLSAIKAENGR
jgi:glycerol-3-phosphate acyltransferase PlsX